MTNLRWLSSLPLDVVADPSPPARVCSSSSSTCHRRTSRCGTWPPSTRAGRCAPFRVGTARVWGLGRDVVEDLQRQRLVGGRVRRAASSAVPGLELKPDAELREGRAQRTLQEHRGGVLLGLPRGVALFQDLRKSQVAFPRRQCRFERAVLDAQGGPDAHGVCRCGSSRASLTRGSRCLNCSSDRPRRSLPPDPR